MPHTKSAEKRVRQSFKRRLRNRAAKATIKTLRAAFLRAVSAGSQSEALRLFTQFCSAVDKALKRGILPANTAARKKSRAAACLNRLIHRSVA